MQNNSFWSPEKVLQHHFMSLTGDSSLAEIIQYYLDKSRILSEDGESSQFYFQFGSEIITIINHSQLSLKSPLQHITVGKATSSAAINRFYISPQTHRHHTGAQTVLLAEKDNWWIKYQMKSLKYYPPPHLSKEAIAEILPSPFNPCIYITQQLLLNLPNIFPPQILTPVGTLFLTA